MPKFEVAIPIYLVCTVEAESAETLNVERAYWESGNDKFVEIDMRTADFGSAEILGIQNEEGELEIEGQTFEQWLDDLVAKKLIKDDRDEAI